MDSEGVSEGASNHAVHALPPLSPRRKSLEWRNHQEMISGGSSPRTPTTSKTDRFSFGVLCFIVLCINSTFSLMAPIFPPEAERRGIIPLVTGIIFSIYNFGNFLISPLLGRLMQTRVISRRTMLAGGCLLSSVAMLGFGLARYIPDKNKALFSTVCLVLRTLNGVGAAATDISSTAIAAQLFQHTNWFGTALGITEACLAIGWMLGPLFGGYLAVWGGFSAPFYSAAIVGVLLAPLSIMMPNAQKTARSELDIQARVSLWTLLSHPEISLFLISAALSAAAVTFLDVTLAPFLKDRVNYSEGTIGDVFAFIAAAYASATVIGGWLSDTFSPMPVIITGLIISVVPFAIMAPSPLLARVLSGLGVPGGVLIWLGAALVGAGCAFGFAPVVPAILRHAEMVGIKDDELPDLVGGLAASSYYLGGGAGPLIGGSLSALVGFPWATTIYGFGLLLFSSVSIIFLLVSKHRRTTQTTQELQARLLSTED